MTTFYLKYRPQTISQLDLASIRQGLAQLLTSFKAGQFPHAFLFSGPKGTGKTSAARIIAKAVNCLNKKDFEPCNQCSLCQSITNASCLDLIEIDAASNRGIDDIRSLREKIKLVPNQAKFKVYVIDEVHMLTAEAFNALLKTLEEPPPHALFVLCTTEISKLPATIRSRCTQFDFQKASVQEIERSLKRVIKGEGLKVDDQALKLIAKQADGSFRDATKILEQLSFSNQSIGYDQVLKLLAGTSAADPEEFVVLVLKGKRDEALKMVEEMSSLATDWRWIISQILEILRQQLLLAVKNDGDLEMIFRLIRIFDQAGREIKGAVISSLPLEMAVIEALIGQKKPGSHKTDQHGAKSVENKFDCSFEKVLQNWPKLLNKVKPSNHSIEALLKAARPVRLEDRYLVVEVFYKFHKEQLEAGRSLTVVENAGKEIFGQNFSVKYILGEKKRASTDQKIKEEKNGDEWLDQAEQILNNRS